MGQTFLRPSSQETIGLSIAQAVGNGFIRFHAHISAPCPNLRYRGVDLVTLSGVCGFTPYNYSVELLQLHPKSELQRYW